MEKLSLNTSLFPIADVAMYGTILDSGEMEYYLNQDEEDEMEINQDKYEKELVYVSSEFIKDNVLETFKKYGIVSIDNFSLYSPAYYNYQNDMLCFDVTLSDDFDDIMKKYISEFEKEEKYKKYIEENWKSCSGFISFMPESIEEILKPSKHFEMRVHQVAAFLTLCILNEEELKEKIDNSIEDFYYYLAENYFEYVEYKKETV